VDRDGVGIRAQEVDDAQIHNMSLALSSLVQVVHK